MVKNFLKRLDEFNKTEFAIMFGNSMKPSMSFMNFVWGEEPNDLVVGDIVAFKRGRFAKLIHRIVDIDEAKGLYYIKGDNAPEVDCVPLSNILFKVRKFKNIL